VTGTTNQEIPFDKRAQSYQVGWRKKYKLAGDKWGWQNGVQREHILPARRWLLGIWPPIRNALNGYIYASGIQPNAGKHNLKSSWVQCANLFFPFRSGRLNKKAKIYGDYADIATLVKRNIIEPLIKFPEKVEDIKSGLTAIPSDSNMEFFPCIVTYEPLYSNQLFHDIIQQELKREGIPEFDFELMSIEDLEWLLSWAIYESPVDFLKAKRAKLEWKAMDVRELVGIKIKERGITAIRNPVLDRIFNKFWQQTVPELSEGRIN